MLAGPSEPSYVSGFFVVDAIVLELICIFRYDAADSISEIYGIQVEEIHKMQENFVAAAVRAKQAGFDGIQLHGCHGYLVNQFISKKRNLRTDEYGGSDQNRARFAVEIIKMIREKCGDDFIISVRTAGIEPDVVTAINIAEEYVKAGCDYLQVSNGIHELRDLLATEQQQHNEGNDQYLLHSKSEHKLLLLGLRGQR